jgi:rubredoxin
VQVSYREYKCLKCGWVHAAISLADAEAQLAAANEYSKLKGRPQTASMDHYRRCFRCGAPTNGFVPAGPGDAPSGCKIQGVVMPELARDT